jgi:hypothetical protein
MRVYSNQEHQGGTTDNREQALALAELSLLSCQRRVHIQYTGEVEAADDLAFTGSAVEIHADPVIGDVFFKLSTKSAFEDETRTYKVHFMQARLAGDNEWNCSSYVTGVGFAPTSVECILLTQTALVIIKREANRKFTNWVFGKPLKPDELFRQAFSSVCTARVDSVWCRPMAPYLLQDDSVTILQQVAREDLDSPGWGTWLLSEGSEVFKFEHVRFMLEPNYRWSMLEYLARSPSLSVYYAPEVYEGIETEFVLKCKVLKGRPAPARVLLRQASGKLEVLWEAGRDDAYLKLEDLVAVSQAVCVPARGADEYAQKCRKYREFFELLILKRGTSRLRFAAYGSVELRAAAVLFGGVHSWHTAETGDRNALSGNQLDNRVVVTDADDACLMDVRVCEPNWVMS